MLRKMVRALGSLARCHALLGLGFLVIGCRSNETMARESFAHSFTCPEDRITVTPRKDLAAVDLALRPATPPAEIAADPGRLALWKAEAARGAADYEHDAVLQARGCGHEVFYLCGDLRVSVGATRSGCMSAPFPPTTRSGVP